MKKILISFGSGVAVALGFAVWVLWMIGKHQKNLKDAENFLLSGYARERAKILEDLEIENLDFETKKHMLRDKVEAQTKEEIIHAFKKAFHVAGDDPDHGEFVGSSGPEPPSSP